MFYFTGAIKRRYDNVKKFVCVYGYCVPAMINFMTLRKLSLFTTMALSMLSAAAIADNTSNIVETNANMSDLDSLFSQASIEIKYPMTVFFDKEGLASAVHYSTRQQSAFKDESNTSASDISTKNISQANILNEGDYDALLFIINEQLCTACRTEREALEAFAESNPEDRFGIIYVEFQ